MNSSNAIKPHIATLQTSRIQEVFDLGFSVKNLIPLWVGESDLATPEFISKAAYAAMQAGETRYTHKRGIPSLRESLKRYTDGLYQTNLDLERVTVTSSGMQSIMLSLQAILGPGDNAIVVSPVWPNICQAVRILGGEVREVALSSDGARFNLDLDKLIALIDEKTRVIFYCSPSNPTGWLIPDQQRRDLLAVCRKRGIWLMADEVYHRIVRDGGPTSSILNDIEPEDQVLVIHSFSKAWIMTGWRLGWLIHPPSFGSVIGRIIEFNTSGAPTFIQHAARVALDEGEPFIKEFAAYCETGRQIVLQRLGGFPRVRLTPPEAGFYTFLAVDGMTDSLAEAKHILAKTGVGLAPGSAFGKGGEGHLRLTFANSPARLAEAFNRLEGLWR